MHKKLELGFRSSSSVLGLGWMFFLQPFYTIFISWGHSPDRDWLSDGTVALEGPWHTEEGWGFTFVMALVTVICLQKLIQGIYFLTKRQQKKNIFSIPPTALSCMSISSLQHFVTLWRGGNLCCHILWLRLVNKESSLLSKMTKCQTVWLLPKVGMELSNLSCWFKRPRLDPAPLAVSASPCPRTEEFLLCRQIPFPNSPMISLLSDI